MPKKKLTEAADTAPEKKPVARRRTIKKAEPTSVSSTTITWDDVATRAYFIHLEEGGDPIENWVRAEHELIPA